MIWSPMQYFKLKLNCPIDGADLCLGDRTSQVVKPNNKNNPRLAFNLFNNVLIIQRRIIVVMVMIF